MRFIGKLGSFEHHEFRLEEDFEKRIYKFRKELFRGGMIVRWDPLLKCGLTGEGVKPDTLLVDLDLNDWWVVEIELGRRKKISEMVDQIGKLSRVDYTKHREDIFNGLKKMGISEAVAKEKSIYFSSISPNFMLILDKENAEMISQAKDRGFFPLVAKTYRNSDGDTRLLLPREHTLTKEPTQDYSESVELRVEKTPMKPNIVNGNWWANIPESSLISNFESITIHDDEGTFVVTIAHAGNQRILMLPVERKSIHQIIKGNKVGILSEDQIEGIFNLKLTWT